MNANAVPYVPRVRLVTVDPSLVSSYGPGGKTGPSVARAALTFLHRIEAGRATPDTAAALLALDRAIAARGGDLRVTDLYRSTATQAAAHARYVAWDKAGRPAPGSSGYDPKAHKAAFVAPAGRSFHNAGRAIDFDTSACRFAGVAADKQLDTVWEIAIPLGWRPIIKAATEGASESWHLDYYGPWEPVRARLGYEQAAIAAVLDVGEVSAFPTDAHRRHVQAQLHRAGYDVGAIDGIVGRRTESALAASGYRGAVADVAAVVGHVNALPDSPVVVWRG